jgi:hypothetical protein
MTLRESKQLIRRWISERFSDERLAEVYAFNQDGKMMYESPCCCLLGVTGAENLHEAGSGCDKRHYIRIRETVPIGMATELAYNFLGNIAPHWMQFGDPLRRRRLSAILRAQMRIRAQERRARQRQPEPALAR